MELQQRIQSKERLIKAMQKMLLVKLKNENQMKLYREHPEKWLTERMGMPLRTVKWDDYPGYEGHQWDGTENPLLTAWNDLADGYNVGVESATGTGKTYWLALVVLWFLDTFENPLVVTCAPKRDQLKLLLWSEISRNYERFVQIRPNSVLNTLSLKKDTSHPKFRVSAEAVGFVAGVGADEESATKAQGFHREHMLIIVEETPGVHQAIMTAFGNTSTGEKNFILAVGNPDNQLDALHQFCEKSDTKHVRISAYDHPNVVVKRDVIPGAVSQRSVKQRLETYGEESQFYKSRVRGISPSEPEDGLFKLAWINAAADVDRPVVDDNTFNALGVDVANSEEGDKACLAWGRSNTLVQVHEFQCPNANHLAYNTFLSTEELVAKKVQDYHTGKMGDYDMWDFCVGVDSVGVGVGTVNTYYEHGYNVVALQGKQLDAALILDAENKPLYTFNSKRSQMYWELREDLRNGKLFMRLPEKVLKQLRKELMIHTYSTKGGKIVVIPKEEIKKKLGGKSPNMSDAVAYWNHVRKGWYQTGAADMIGA